RRIRRMSLDAADGEGFDEVAAERYAVEVVDGGQPRAGIAADEEAIVARLQGREREELQLGAGDADVGQYRHVDIVAVAEVARGVVGQAEVEPGTDRPHVDRRAVGQAQ